LAEDYSVLAMVLAIGYLNQIIEADAMAAFGKTGVNYVARAPQNHEELFIALHDHLPPELICERELLICRL
jgi:hypothetical protein